MNNNLGGALYWYGREKYAAAVVRGYLKSLAEEAQLDPHKFRLSLEPSAWVDSEDEGVLENCAAQPLCVDSDRAGERHAGGTATACAVRAVLPGALGA